MLSLQLLPTALLALLWASPALALPTSVNDPLRAISAHAPRKADPPVCCLKPLPSLEPLEEEVLLSFEEWKMKQTIVQEKAKAKDTINRSTQAISGGTSGESGNGSETAILSPNVGSNGESLDLEEVPKSPTTEALSPHFRVPLVDRFNYASLDCSARVHMAHRSAKSTSSILSSKRDRYMLSPCNSPNKEQRFVVVELCEDIRIDTVQLANFEFFSGVFKDFQVSVAKTQAEGWTNAGVYRAKNVRGVQSFHPPTSLRDFYRYIRIDFLSHYGNEYYCPVSLLRVYGLTHLEQWKWDTWEAESRAKTDNLVKKDDLHIPSTHAGVVADAPILEHLPEATNEAVTKGTLMTSISVSSSPPIVVYNTPTQRAAVISTEKGSTQASTSSAPVMSASGPTQTPVQQTATVKPTDTSSISPSVIDTDATSTPIRNTSPIPVTVGTSTSSLTKVISSSTRQPNTSSTSVTISQTLPPDAPLANNANVSSSRFMSPLMASQQSSVVKGTATTLSTTPSPSVIISSPAASPPVIPVTTGGESIYRTIMNRLTALEGNHTLYARYVEQQTSGVRELLKRLGEDVGRLEGIGRSQAQMHQRTIRDWERRQQQLQMDYGELMSRVEYLSDEIVLEKRLGIAQLCLLLAVLVFMGLTRGSRGEPMVEHNSMREWGRRHLSFSGDWATRFKVRGRSISAGRNAIKAPLPSARVSKLEQDNMKIAFPQQETTKKDPLELRNLNTRPILSDISPHRRQLKSRSRTPSLRTSGSRQHQQRPVTPTSSGFPPRLHRSNSQGLAHAANGTGTPHKSAKKWARTAHLHEVRNTGSSKKKASRDNMNENVFLGPVPLSFPQWKGEDGFSTDLLKSDRKAKSIPVAFKFEDGEGDQWVDTDLDESEGDWDIKVETGRSMTSSAGNEH